jgi:hypothetical protein
MRQPRVAGVGGGVGTTTVALALRARDDARYLAGRPVDLLVCRTTTVSVEDAWRAVAGAPEPPLLAVVADVPAGTRVPVLARPVRARLEQLEPLVSALVAVPFVRAWRSTEDPYAEASHVLRAPAVPRALREFTDAMALLVERLHERMGPVPPARARWSGFDPVPAARSRPAVKGT